MNLSKPRSNGSVLQSYENHDQWFGGTSRFIIDTRSSKYIYLCYLLRSRKCQISSVKATRKVIQVCGNVGFLPRTSRHRRTSPTVLLKLFFEQYRGKFSTCYYINQNESWHITSRSHGIPRGDCRGGKKRRKLEAVVDEGPSDDPVLQLFLLLAMPGWSLCPRPHASTPMFVLIISK